MSQIEKSFFSDGSQPNDNFRQGPCGGDVGVMRDDRSTVEVDRLD